MFTLFEDNPVVYGMPETRLTREQLRHAYNGLPARTALAVADQVMEQLQPDRDYYEKRGATLHYFWLYDEDGRRRASIDIQAADLDSSFNFGWGLYKSNEQSESERVLWVEAIRKIKNLIEAKLLTEAGWQAVINLNLLAISEDKQTPENPADVVIPLKPLRVSVSAPNLTVERDSDGVVISRYLAKLTELWSETLSQFRSLQQGGGYWPVGYWPKGLGAVSTDSQPNLPAAAEQQTDSNQAIEEGTVNVVDEWGFSGTVQELQAAVNTFSDNNPGLWLRTQLYNDGRVRIDFKSNDQICQGWAYAQSRPTGTVVTTYTSKGRQGREWPHLEPIWLLIVQDLKRQDYSIARVSENDPTGMEKPFRKRLSPLKVAQTIELVARGMGYKLTKPEELIGGMLYYVVYHEDQELFHIAVSSESDGAYFTTSTPRSIGIGGAAYVSKKDEGFKRMSDFESRIANLRQAISERIEQEERIAAVLQQQDTTQGKEIGHGTIVDGRLVEDHDRLLEWRFQIDATISPDEAVKIAQQLATISTAATPSIAVLQMSQEELIEKAEKAYRMEQGINAIPKSLLSDKTNEIRAAADGEQVGVTESTDRMLSKKLLNNSVETASMDDNFNRAHVDLGSYDRWEVGKALKESKPDGANGVEILYNAKHMKQFYNHYDVSIARRIVTVLPEAKIKCDSEGERWTKTFIAKHAHVTRETASRYLNAFIRAGITVINEVEIPKSPK